MVTVRYPYKPKPGVMLIATAFFAVGAAVLWFGAAMDGRALIVEGLIRLEPEQAAIFYRVLAVVSALMAAGGVAGVIMGLSQPRYLVFEADRVDVPGYIGKRGQTIAYRDITGLQVQAVRNQRFIYIHHRSGKIAIMASMLPDAAAFETVCQMLKERSGRAL